MTSQDRDYIRKLLDAGVVGSPCLELGAGYGGETCREPVEARGIVYRGTDMVAHPNVDVVVDFELPPEQFRSAFEPGATFASILILNVLEHTFNPLAVLDNAASLLAPGGTIIVVAPSVWALHNHPYDCWRVNPDFYVEYARRRSLTIDERFFEYVGFHHVRANQRPSGEFELPTGQIGRFARLKSRVIHRLFNTTGRGVRFPSFIATAVVMRR